MSWNSSSGNGRKRVGRRQAADRCRSCGSPHQNRDRRARRLPLASDASSYDHRLGIQSSMAGLSGGRGAPRSSVRERVPLDHPGQRTDRACSTMASEARRRGHRRARAEARAILAEQPAPRDRAPGGRGGVENRTVPGAVDDIPPVCLLPAGETASSRRPAACRCRVLPWRRPSCLWRPRAPTTPSAGTIATHRRGGGAVGRLPARARDAISREDRGRVRRDRLVRTSTRPCSAAIPTAWSSPVTAPAATSRRWSRSLARERGGPSDRLPVPRPTPCRPGLRPRVLTRETAATTSQRRPTCSGTASRTRGGDAEDPYVSLIPPLRIQDLIGLRLAARDHRRVRPAP